jgi:hypothetical protein
MCQLKQRKYFLFHNCFFLDLKRTIKAHRIQKTLLKWFYDTSTDTATRAAYCGSLLEGLRLSTLKQDGHGGHENLCGSGRRSVISYVLGENCCIIVCVVQL